MTKKTTNVRTGELNYDKYASEIYDEDIRRSIPGHTELHMAIEKVAREFLEQHEVKKFSSLGLVLVLPLKKYLSLCPPLH